MYYFYIINIEITFLWLSIRWAESVLRSTFADARYAPVALVPSSCAPSFSIWPFCFGTIPVNGEITKNQTAIDK